MDYESWEDFVDEWSQPDSLNFLVSYSYSAGEIATHGTWYLSILQARKGRIQDVAIGPVMHLTTFQKVKQWADQSVEVLKQKLDKDEQYAHDEYVNNLPGESK